MSPLMAVADPMPTIKEWALADPGVAAVVAERVFFETPKGFLQPAVPPPWLVVALVNTETESGDGPFVYPHVQFDCWASDGAQAGALRAAVYAAALNIGAPFRGSEGVIYGAEPLVGGGWAPDRESRRPRYVLTVRFLFRAA